LARLVRSPGRAIAPVDDREEDVAIPTVDLDITTGPRA
jgi:hypothetical protein